MLKTKIIPMLCAITLTFLMFCTCCTAAAAAPFDEVGEETHSFSYAEMDEDKAEQYEKDEDDNNALVGILFLALVAAMVITFAASSGKKYTYPQPPQYAQPFTHMTPQRAAQEFYPTEKAQSAHPLTAISIAAFILMVLFSSVKILNLSFALVALVCTYIVIIKKYSAASTLKVEIAILVISLMVSYSQISYYL